MAPMDSISKKSPKAYHKPMTMKMEAPFGISQQAFTPFMPSSCQAKKFTKTIEKTWLMIAGEFLEYNIFPSTLE